MPIRSSRLTAVIATAIVATAIVGPAAQARPAFDAPPQNQAPAQAETAVKGPNWAQMAARKEAQREVAQKAADAMPVTPLVEPADGLSPVVWALLIAGGVLLGIVVLQIVGRTTLSRTIRSRTHHA